ncbi:hypothetical protein ACYRFS_02310 [Listeria kieliensis]
MRDVIRSSITESKGKEPEYRISVNGNISEESYSLARIHEMLIKRTTAVSGKTYEQTKKDYLEALDVIIGNIHDAENEE